MFSCRYISVCKHHKIVLMPTLYYHTWAKKLSSNFYQNPSTFADVMHKSILVCFCAPQCT